MSKAERTAVYEECGCIHLAGICITCRRAVGIEDLE